MERKYSVEELKRFEKVMSKCLEIFEENGVEFRIVPVIVNKDND